MMDLLEEVDENALDLHRVHSCFGREGWNDLWFQEGRWFGDGFKPGPFTPVEAAQRRVFVPREFEPYVFTNGATTAVQDDEDELLAAMSAAVLSEYEQSSMAGRRLAMFSQIPDEWRQPDELAEMRPDYDVPPAMANFKQKPNKIAPRVLRHGQRGIQKQLQQQRQKRTLGR